MRTVLALGLCLAAAPAATISTNLTANLSGALSVTTGAFTVTGPVTLTNIGSGTVSSSISLSAIGGATITAPFTITLSGGGGTITGTVSIPSSLLTGAGPAGNSSVTVTGGTGTYAGATGSFPNLTGTVTGGSIATTVTFTLSGAGTINTAGSGGGGGGGTPAPTITAVWDAAGNTPTLAPGSIFIVKGSNLCPSGQHFYNVPRPTVSTDGVKITFASAGGSSTDALIWYTYNPSGTCQLAAILPSSVTPGSYNVTVTNGTASAPFAATVVATKPALFTQDSTGTGLASVQNIISATTVDLNSFTTGAGKATTISPAHPGEYIQAYATGLGGVNGQDNTASPIFDFTANGATVRAIVGGRSLPALFAGRAGYAGEDQINVQLPDDVPTGCTVPFQLSVNGVLSNQTFIAIAPDKTSTACVAPGLTTAQLQKLDNGGTFTFGTFTLTQISQTVPQVGTVKLNSAAGSFIQYGASQLASGAAQGSSFSISPGSCNVSKSTRTGTTAQPVYYTTLDAGNVTLNGPAASQISNRQFKQTTVPDPVTGVPLIGYTMALASEGLPSIPGITADTGTIVAGTYTLAGGGGKDVNAFNTSITVGPPLSIPAGLPGTVNRGNGLTINWTGGTPGDLVQIGGSASTVTGSGSTAVTDSTSFICYANVAAGTFTVPATILSQLPPSQQGSLQVFDTPNFNTTTNQFTAGLTAGGSIDFGTFFAIVGQGAVVAYQ